MFAAIWQFRRQPWAASSGGPADGLYRSRDGGRSWAKISGHGFPGGLLGRIGIAVAPGDPRRVYALVQSKEGTVWRSDDGGDTWTRTSTSTLPEQRPFYFSHLAVDPRDRNRIISLSMFMTVSKDGGRSWKHLTATLHADNHAIWWSADGKRIIEGNDGGVVLSNDGGNGWAFLDRLPLAQLYHVGFDLGKPYTICGGLQDNYAWCAPTTARNGVGIMNRDWFTVTGGDGMFAVPDPLDPSLIWSNSQAGQLGIYDTKARQIVDVSPYPRDTFGSPTSLAESPYRFNWNAPLAFSPQDGHVAYFGGNVVFATHDRGRHWTPISPDLTRNEKAHQGLSGGPITLDVSGAENFDTLLALAPSPTTAGLIWAGSDDGLVQLTRDGGAHWRDVTPKDWPTYGRVEVIEPSAQAPGTAFAVLDRHDEGDRAPYVYVTDDYGASWKLDRRRLAARCAGAGGPPGPARAEPALRRHRDGPVALVRPRRALGTAAGRAADGAGLRHPHPPARRRPAGGDPRARFLRARRPRAAAAAGRRAARRRGVLPAARGDAVGRLALGRRRPRAGRPFRRPERAQRRAADLLPAAPGRRSGPGSRSSTRAGASCARLRGPQPFDPADPPKDERGRYYVGNAAGLNRITWDGSEDGPTRWLGTSFQNAGPASRRRGAAGRVHRAAAPRRAHLRAALHAGRRPAEPVDGAAARRAARLSHHGAGLVRPHRPGAQRARRAAGRRDARGARQTGSRCATS